MSRINRPGIGLLIAGLSLMNIGFVLSSRLALGDFSNGIIKGVSLGLLLLSVLVGKRRQASN